MTVSRRSRTRKSMPRGGDKDLAELQRTFTGRLFMAGDDGYEASRTVWNSMIDRKPAIIARCRTVADVQRAVTFARNTGLEVSIRGGGHASSGSSIRDDAVVIDMREMRRVSVDPDRKIARVQGGATLGDIDRVTQEHGLALPTGVVSMTGIGGLALRGGYGHLVRRFGLTCDNINSLEVVTADGNVVTTSATENADLFWALRGGSLSMGVVTEFRFHLHPVGPEINLIMRLYPIEMAPAIMGTLGERMASAPDELSMITAFLTVPSQQPFPEALHGRSVIGTLGTYSGDAARYTDATGFMAGFGTPLLDMSGRVPFSVVQTVLDANYDDKDRRYWKSAYLTDLTPEAIEVICRNGSNRPTPISAINSFFLGGAIARVNPEDSVIAHRRAKLLVAAEANWRDPADDERCIAWSRRVIDELLPFSDGGPYMNMAGLEDEHETLARKSYGANFDRLLAIKTKYDPEGLF